MAENKEITCMDCSKSFTFTVEQQQFYAEKGWDNDPRRCKPCADINKQKRNAENGGTGDRPQRQMYPITCDSCKQPGEAPFQPRSGKPVLCGNCHRQQRG